MTRPVMRVLRPHMGRLLVAGLAGVAAEVCGIGLVAAAAWMIARAAEQPPLAALGPAVVAVRASAIFKGVFRYGERLAGHDAALRVLADLRTRVFDAVAARKETIRDGDVLTRMVSDVDGVQDLLLRCALPALAAPATGAAALGLVTAVHPPAGAVLATGLTVAGLLVPGAVYLTSRRTGALIAEARTKLTLAGLDVLEGAEDLAAFGATARAMGTAAEAAERLARLERRAAAITGTATAVGVIVQAATALAMLLAARAEGTVTTAMLTLTALVAVETALPLTAAAHHLSAASPAARRVAALLPPPPPRRPAETPQDAACPGRADGPLAMPSGPLGIALLGVRADYGDRPALCGVDLHIERGRRVAVVGASGAGKSSLLAALCGELPISGALTLAGADRGRYDPVDVRRAVRGLTQDAHIFTATIRANLLLARPDATDADLEAAARRAHLLAFVDSLPSRWDTEISPTTLSGGQRQRVLLARAFLADPQILLLDEPTEGLDAQTADAITSDLLSSPTGGTLVLVTHRLTVLDDADEILVMDSGRIVQRGPHTHLSAAPGPYRDLLDAEQLTTRHLELAPPTSLARASNSCAPRRRCP